MRLIVEEGYTFKSAATAVGVSDQSLRAWHAKFAPPPEPCGENATVAELREENQRLRRQLKHRRMPRQRVAERFFWSLKHEWTKHESFADLEAARLSVFKYIETFYNSVRLHQALGYKSPNQFETAYAPVLPA